MVFILAYYCVLLFVQMNMVPSGVWKLLPRLNQTCGGLQFFGLADFFSFSHDVKQRGTDNGVNVSDYQPFKPLHGYGLECYESVVI